MAALIKKHKGYFYAKPNRKKDSWTLYYERYEEGKAKHCTITVRLSGTGPSIENRQ